MKNKNFGIGLFIAFVLMISLFVFGAEGAFAYDDPTLTLTEFNTAPGETFSTTLTVAEDAGIMGFEVTLNYDTELLTLISATDNEDSLGDVVFNDDSEGIISVTYSRTKNLSKSAPILDLVFKVDDNAGVGVYDCLTVDTANPVKSARLVNNTTTQFPLAVDFQKVEIHQMGDVDLNNEVDILDAIVLRRYLVELESLSDFQLDIADTCYDGTVDITDATYIQRKLVKLKVIYGNRVDVNFYDADGNLYGTKSVLFDGTLSKLPAVPNREGYDGGQWSASATEYVAPTLSNLQETVSLYAVYSEKIALDMEYYKQQLTEMYFSGDLATNLSSDLSLVSSLDYQNGEHATITWASTNNYILNSTTGKFTKPTYPTGLTLTAQIVAYNAGGAITGRDYVSFVYSVPGSFDTPTKAEIREWMEGYFSIEDGSYLINYDLKLPQKVTNEQVPSAGDKEYEVRISWEYSDNGAALPISEITRTTTSQTMDLIATVTFNGEPLEDDGKIYLDSVHVSAIQEFEIRAYIIEQIAAGMGQTLSNGVSLWNNDTVYGTSVQWETGNVELANVENNVINISTATVNGALLPLKAHVTYLADDEAKEFVLEYTASLVTANELLVPGTNISAEFYDALKHILPEQIPGFSGNITTGILRDYRFVTLDLSEYTDVTNLEGLSYCTNLRVLNISGLHIESGMNQVATLSNLETFVARGCDLSELSAGGTPVLANSVNLKLLDLSDNNFTSLDSVLDEGVRYGKLREVYLADNQLEDISALSRAPIMTYLSLAGNGLETEDIQVLANFPYLMYLSLADNQIDDISALKGLTYLTELRLQNNQITNVQDLQRLVRLEALYLGHNQITTGIPFLNNLSELQILYLNDNNISSVRDLSSLTKLVAINVSDNPNLSDLSVLSNYTATLEEVYAENDALTSFNFIVDATKLRILMLSGNAKGRAMYSDLLSSQLSQLTELEILTLSDKPLRDLSFLNSMTKLKRLDVANCTLTGAESDLVAIAGLYKTLGVLDISNNDMSGAEEAIKNLRYLSKLVILYADNICDGFDATTITNEMMGLHYVSLENCGVDNLDWLTYKHGLVYVDLAGNDFTDVNLGSQLGRSIESLHYLYLEPTGDSTFSRAYLNFDQNVLWELSLEGVKVNTLSNLPRMDSLRYLNIASTGLTRLDGDNPDMVEKYSIERFQTVETLDVSDLQTDISLVQNLNSLTTLYAVSVPEDMMFYKTDLHVLESLYKAGKVTSYLYLDDDDYEPVATREGKDILDLIEDYSCSIMVAADGVISDNNPELIDEINDFDITWTVSNDINYEVKDGQIAVKSYDNINDETLTLTATIRVYDDQETVSRDFAIDTHILRICDFAEYEETEPVSLDGYGLFEDEDEDTVDEEMLDEEMLDEEALVPVTNDTSEQTAESASDEAGESEEVTESGNETDIVDTDESETMIEETVDVEENNNVEESEESTLATDAVEEPEMDGTSDEEVVEEAVLDPVDEEQSTDEDAADIEEEQSASEIVVMEESSDSADEQPAEEPAIDDETTQAGETGNDAGEPNEAEDQTADAEDENLPAESEDEAENSEEAEETEEVEEAEVAEIPVWLDGASKAQYIGTVPCIKYTVSGLDDYIKRGHTFVYEFSIQAAEHEGFSEPVKPVEDEVKYSFSSILENGNATPYANVLTIGENGNYTINEVAPLNSVTTITTSIGHYINEEFVADETMQRSFTVVSQSYTAYYETNGGTMTLKADGSIITQQEMPEETVMFQNVTIAKPGYLFAGWYTDAELSDLFSDGTSEVRMPSHNITLYAKWVDYSYVITLDANGGTVDPAELVAYCDQEIGTLPTPIRVGYHFDGWFTEDGDEITSTTVRGRVEDVTFYARWTAEEYTLSFDACGGSDVEETLTVTYKQTVGELPITEKNGYSFVGWYTAQTEGEEVTAESLYQVAGDSMLYARWNPNVYTVTFDPNGGVVETASKSVEFASAYGALPTATKAGFSLTGWFTAASGGTQIYASDTYDMADNQTLYAHWTAKSYTVTWQTGTGYSISVKRTSSPYAGATTGSLTSGSAVYYGDVLSVTYTASTNYKITSSGATQVTVTGNVGTSKIYAVAELDKVVIGVCRPGTFGLVSSGDRVKSYVEIYTLGNKIGMRGWAYDEANTSKSVSLQSLTYGYQHIEYWTANGTTQTCSEACPIGDGHYFDFIMDGTYSNGDRVMLHVWLNYDSSYSVNKLADTWCIFGDSGIVFP